MRVSLHLFSLHKFALLFRRLQRVLLFYAKEMPLAVRYVQPKRLCRGPLPRGVKNELHAVAVLSLAGTIRQISSLAKHAESLLGELCDTLGKYNERTLSLQNRVTHLRKKVIPSLDIQAEGIWTSCNIYSKFTFLFLNS